jgi:hypothetical protein
MQRYTTTSCQELPWITCICVVEPLNGAPVWNLIGLQVSHGPALFSPAADPKRWLSHYPLPFIQIISKSEVTWPVRGSWNKLLHAQKNRISGFRSNNDLELYEMRIYVSVPQSTRILMSLTLLFFFSSGVTAQRKQGPPHSLSFLDHTHSHTTFVRTGLDKRPIPDNTQHLQQTDTRGPGGIRTYNSSKRAAADPQLRPLDH